MLLFLSFFVSSFDPSYCEPPLLNYQTRNDADLIQVQILTRHGARTPLHTSKTQKNVWTCEHTELKSIEDDVSHPLHVTNSFGKSIFMGNCQFGQLVDKGHNALTRLGQHMREIYVNTLKFLPTRFNHNIMKFRSTYTIRTLHSQMAFVRGMYPDISELTIHTADKQYDPWRRTSNICPKLTEMMENLKNGSEWKEAGLDDDNLTRKMSAVFGVHWEHTNDAVTSTRCEGFPLPPNITHEEIDKAVSLKARQRQFIFQHDSVFPLFFSFSAAEMLNEMIDRINGESKLRFIHWSAHDGNIMAFLGFLGYGDDRWPPYGSYIVAELWKFRKGKQYFIQFRYNGKLLKIPRFSYSRVIPFDDFKKFVKNHIPDMRRDCNFDLNNFLKKDTFEVKE
ncbi:histidine acid phosphatase [Tritrichomonas foetus]|uniref:Histidine acid phosphatase n=1 Tax=Tritrichomonas foetus TaxID=1144522 RepID=A0A1J4JGQ5_9EUKA|nr:histidine acid phosphatase [Tritrichomonas foetus]|eukprot:OHS98336.1 histidine acid phosphatase [Tritrichomonas foetus]